MLCQITIPSFLLTAAGYRTVLSTGISGASVLSDGTHSLYYTDCSAYARQQQELSGTRGFYDTGFYFFDIQADTNWDECSFNGQLTAVQGFFSGHYAGLSVGGFTASVKNLETTWESISIPSISATGFTIAIPLFSDKGNLSSLCIEPFCAAGKFSFSTSSAAGVDKLQPSIPWFISCGLKDDLFTMHNIIMQYGTTESFISDSSDETVLSGKLSDALLCYYAALKTDNFTCNAGGGMLYTMGNYTGEFTSEIVSNLLGFDYTTTGEFSLLAVGAGALLEYRSAPFTFHTGAGVFFIPFEKYSTDTTYLIDCFLFSNIRVEKNNEDSYFLGKGLVPMLFSLKIAFPCGKYSGTILFRKVLAIPFSLSNYSNDTATSKQSYSTTENNSIMQKILLSGISCSVQLKF